MAIEDRGSEVEGVAIQFIVLAVGSFALRVYVRAHMVKAWGWDDWLMTVATIAFLFFVSTVLAGVVHGIGRRFKDLSKSDIEQALMVSVPRASGLEEISIEGVGGLTLSITVLDLQLHLVFLDHDPIQALHCDIPLTHRRHADLQVDPLRYDVRQRRDGPRLLLHHAISMHAGRILLAEKSDIYRTMHAGRCHHQRDLRLFGAQHPRRLYLGPAARHDHVEPPDAPQDEAGHLTAPEYGLHRQHGRGAAAAVRA